MSERGREGCVLLFGVVMMCAAAILLLGEAYAGWWRYDAIKHGCAHYDTTTAEWQWGKAKP